MARSPVIRTKRLSITPFSKRHLTERYVGWLNDSELMRFSEQRYKMHTLESCNAYWQSFEESPNYFWAILTNDEPLSHIGSATAYVDKINKIADVGILIGESEANGKGYASEAFKVICDFLLSNTKLRKVTAGTISLNEAMLKVMKKAGMVQDGVRVRHFLCENKEVDIIHMALFRKECMSKDL